MVFISLLKSTALVSAFLSAVNAKLKTVELTHPYGSSAEIFLFGAQVKSFHPAMDPKLDVLYMSKDSPLDGVNPIHGGISVVFPNYGSAPGLPINGFAHSTSWTLVSIKNAENKESPSVAKFTLSSSETTQKMWPYDFELEYEVQLFGNQLKTALHVHNTFTKDIEFQTSLTNYLQVDNLLDGGVTLTGLKGVNYVDRVTNASKTETREFIKFTEDPFSFMYVDAPDQLVTTIMGSNTVDRSVTVQKKAFIADEANLKVSTDAVVSNPGGKEALKVKGFGDGKHVNMIAVEPGRVSVAQALPAKKTYTLEQSIMVTSF